MTNQEYYFGFNGTIQRADYFVSGIILPSLFIVLGSMMINMLHSSVVVDGLLMLVVVIIAFWINIAVTIKRIKDLGYPPVKFYLLTLVPIIGFIPLGILMFMNGTGTNAKKI